MIVKYSALRNLDIPKFTLCNPGSVYNNGLLSKAVGILVDHEAEELVFNFNSTSEFNLRVNRVTREDPEENAHTYNLYKSIQNRRLIFVEDIGYFMITGVEDGYDGATHYKDIKAQSIDIEIAQKMIPYIADGTYKFTSDETGTNKGVLETIVETLPLWTIGYVDDTVASKWRTFEDVDTSLNCLAFLLENVQDAYECIIIFDCIERTINVYAQDNYVRQTNIHITKDDLINSLDISENADELYTAISVLGGDNITIGAINPLGTNVIYNFDYYLSWMSDGLGAKVKAWQDTIDGKMDEYYNLNLRYYQKFAEASNLQAELDKLAAQLKIYNRCRDNIVAEASTAFVESYNAVIVENGGTPITIYKEIKDTLSDIDNLIAECERRQGGVSTELDEVNVYVVRYKDDIAKIHRELSITDYFTEDEYTELCHYIFEGSYTDEYVTITDIMTYEEKFEQMKILYDRAKGRLERVSQPTQEFSVDVENFIFVKEFADWSEQLETGCLINVELDTNDIALLFLSNITINYDDRSLSMTFGNRFNKFDTKSLFDDVLGNISKSANTLSYIKELIYPIKSGEFSHMQEALQTSRDLTMGAALSSTNEEVVIDASGYTGRRLLRDGEYDPRQIKISCNSIVLTDDAWDSCKLAVGEILLGNGDSVYGVNADAIMGRIILGENLHILNESNNLSFSNDGFVITNGKNTFTVNPNATNLLSVKNDKNQSIFYVDESGELYVKGSVLATGGTIGGWDISPNGLYYAGTATTPYIYTDSPVGISGTSTENAFWAGYGNHGTAAAPNWYSKFQVKRDGTLIATSATITGNITATSLTLSDGASISGLSYNSLSDTPTIPDLDGVIYKGDITQTTKTDSNGISYTQTTVPTASGGTITYDTYDAGDYIVFGTNMNKKETANIVVSRDGLLTARNALIYGTVYATDGEFAGKITSTEGAIGCWSITANDIRAGNYTQSNGGTTIGKIGMSATDPDYAFWAGYDRHDSNSVYAKFQVKHDGTLIARNATITGTVNAGSGSIGGWTIDQNGLYYAGTATTPYTYHNSPVGISGVSSENVFWAGYDSTTGKSKFQVKRNGTLITDNITATGGTIGGFSIDSDGIYYNPTGTVTSSNATMGMSATMSNWAFWAGYDGSSAKFQVTRSGDLYANSATITGVLTAGVGSSIGGFAVDSNSIYKGSWGTSAPSVFMSTGTSGSYTIGGTTTTNWVFGAGGTFGVTGSGSLYCTSGKIGGWNINASYLQGTSGTTTVSISPASCYYSTSSTSYKSTSWYNVVNSANAWANGSSDLNVKNTISNIDDYDTMFDNLNPCRYKYNHGTSGRYHTGFIAQEVVSAIESAGLTTQDFAGVIHLEEPDDNGCEWMLRRDEFVALNTWQIQKLKQRVAELEAKLEAL